jgi:anti-sigma B factor antagonist
MGFDITDEERSPGVWVMTLTGQFDFSRVSAARTLINKRVEEGAQTLVVNLDGLEYIDSAGLGVLVGTLARLRERDGKLAVVCNNPRVRRVFEITKLTQLLALYETEGEAIGERVAGPQQGAVGSAL